MAMDLAARTSIAIRSFSGSIERGQPATVTRVANSCNYLWNGASLPTHPSPGKATKAITDVTRANPCVVTCTAHGFESGQLIYIKGIGGMSQINNKFFIVTNSTANSFKLRDVNGVNINSSVYTTYTSGGTAENTSTLRELYFGNFAAVYVGIKWREVEPNWFTYDWSLVKAHVEACAAKRVFGGIYFEYKHFDTKKYRNAVPDHLVSFTNSAGKAGIQVASGNQDGFAALISDQVCNNHLRRCLESLFRELGDHPWFAGVEYAETAGIAQADGGTCTINGTAIVSGKNKSLKWDDATATGIQVHATGNSFANTAAGSLSYEYAYGRLLRDFARKRPGLMVIGGTNLFPGRGGSAIAIGFHNTFMPDGDAFEAMPNLASGGHDILFEQGNTLTGTQAGTTGLNRNSYPTYITTTNSFFKHRKKCAMQHDSHKASENGGMHPRELWKWARNYMRLSMIQWNYQTYYTYLYGDQIIAIAGVSTVVPATYASPDFGPTKITSEASMSTTGVFTTGTGTEKDSYTGAIQYRVTANPVTSDQNLFYSDAGGGKFTKIYIDSVTQDLKFQVNDGALTTVTLAGITHVVGIDYIIVFKHCVLESRIYLWSSLKGGNPTSAIGATKSIGANFQICGGAQVTLGAQGAVIVKRALAGGREGTGNYSAREFKSLRPNWLFTNKP